MRSIVFDTETTGMNKAGRDKSEGHRIIEIGCVELIDRHFTGREFQCYLNPEQPIDPESTRVHGITDARVKMEPTFAQKAPEFLDFIAGADELIAHNIEFDQMFLNRELALYGAGWRLEERFRLVDTLKLARQIFGSNSRNNLDALCKRYHIDTSHRSLHGALLDSRLLAEVYLKMTSSQNALNLAEAPRPTFEAGAEGGEVPWEGWLALTASAEEQARHQDILQKINS